MLVSNNILIFECVFFLLFAELASDSCMLKIKIDLFAHLVFLYHFYNDAADFTLLHGKCCIMLKKEIQNHP